MLQAGRGLTGNFFRGPSVPLAKRMYEGLFHKSTDQNLAPADCACGGDRLSGGSNRGSGGSSRGGARSCADGAERHLTSDPTTEPSTRNLFCPASIPAYQYQTR